MARHSADAEDLVQGALANALAARNTFVPGTNFSGWMHRILRNLFLADIRRRPRTCDLDDVPDERLAYPAAQFEQLVLAQLRRDLARLPAELRQALALVTVGALPYGAAAEIAGCPVGTIRSRVFRARRHLDASLAGEEAGPRR